MKEDKLVKVNLWKEMSCRPVWSPASTSASERTAPMSNAT
jgi:hypothetical protein